MFQWLGLGAVNSTLLWGALLVASPIIIHLLSKRKFRIVDWAAMEFLLDAERRNRRRIRLEHLILLLLRCLAVVLLALLVARPFLRRTGLAARVVETARFEQIVLLDDSPSMEARLGSKTVFDEAKRLLLEFVRRTARERPGDTLTLLVTSEPSRPILNGQYLTADKVEGATRAIEGLEVSDKAAELDAALLALDELLSGPRGNLNRLVAVVSDLRRRDWLPPLASGRQAAQAGEGAGAKAEASRGAAAVARRLAGKVEGVAIVDVGGEWAPNLSIAEIAVREKALAADVSARFEVVVANHGQSDAADVAVSLIPGNALPLRSTIDVLRAGATVAVPFTYTFREAGSVPVRAELPADVLPRDNTRYLAARIRKGVNILLVDGEPSADYGRTETFYLRRALDPPGDSASGNLVETVTENQFEGLPLDRFQVIVLANLYRVTENRLKALDGWVRRGGGLVFFLGDQVDEIVYNEKLHAGGTGLFPLELSALKGDETARRWVHLSEGSANHPVLRVFEGAQNPFLRRVKFFRWWAGAPSKDALAKGTAQVIATFDDPDGSPAMVEHTLGKGRVLAVTTTADGEWSTWPADPSYLVTVLELARYMTPASGGEGTIGVGQPLRATLDPARYDSDVAVQPPGDAGAAQRQALPSEDGKRLVLDYGETARRGIYRVELKRRDESAESMHWAVNLDPAEGDLRPAGRPELARLLAGSKVAVVSGSEFLSRGAAGARMEIWRAVLIALVAALCIEQALAWWFGTWRS